MNKYYKLIVVLFVFSIILFVKGQSVIGQSANDSRKNVKFAVPTQEEKRLHRLINEYRAQRGLPPIGLSKSLTNVAKMHAYDLQNNPPDRSRGCNMHSWSAKGPWTPCCYTPDHAQAKCMWFKPRELTNYRGYGFECSYGHSHQATAEGSLYSWKGSHGHNAVIINSGRWSRYTWKALGIGIHGRYAVIWFGFNEDPDGYWE